MSKLKFLYWHLPLVFLTKIMLQSNKIVLWTEGCFKKLWWFVVFCCKKSFIPAIYYEPWKAKHYPISNIPSLLILLFLLFFMNVIIIIYIIAGTPSPLVSTRSVDFFVLAKCINYFLIHSVLVLVLYCILLVFYLKVNIKQKAVISWSFCFSFSLFRQWQNLKFQKPDCFNIYNFQNSKWQKTVKQNDQMCCLLPCIGVPAWVIARLTYKSRYFP